MRQNNYVLRRAQLSEAEALTALEVRSKAAWGYDADFMRRASSDLTVTEKDLRESETVVAEVAGEIAGFVRIKVASIDAFMTDLFVEPELFGKGIGRELFRAAVAIARGAGATTLALHADPNAEPFYARMGMRTVTHVKSTLGPERFLPVMVLALE